ncbi:MAG TPA: hypothetical protein VE173_14395 [Longimicrobiales bacterium]|nr:hypothetical protein [Longimicrobiales bacterium]
MAATHVGRAAGLTGPHGLLNTVGSSEWAWTRRRYVYEEREREGLVERLRFWEVLPLSSP